MKRIGLLVGPVFDTTRLHAERAVELGERQLRLVGEPGIDVSDRTPAHHGPKGVVIYGSYGPIDRHTFVNSGPGGPIADVQIATLPTPPQLTFAGVAGAASSS